MENMEFEKIEGQEGERVENKIKDLTILAEKGEDKDWEEIDRQLSTDDFCDFPQVIAWTEEGLDSDSENVRDLAGSILEQSNNELADNIVVKLQSIISRENGGYDEFRAACALFKHGERSEDVVKKLKEFTDDDATKEIAEGYLSQIEE